LHLNDGLPLAANHLEGPKLTRRDAKNSVLISQLHLADKFGRSIYIEVVELSDASFQESYSEPSFIEEGRK
jgi:hypothetical protein